MEYARQVAVTRLQRDLLSKVNERDEAAKKEAEAAKPADGAAPAAAAAAEAPAAKAGEEK
jgi:hypothetical protein